MFYYPLSIPPPLRALSFHHGPLSSFITYPPKKTPTNAHAHTLYKHTYAQIQVHTNAHITHPLPHTYAHICGLKTGSTYTPLSICLSETGLLDFMHWFAVAFIFLKWVISLFFVIVGNSTHLTSLILAFVALWHIPYVMATVTQMSTQTLCECVSIFSYLSP